MRIVICRGSSSRDRRGFTVTSRALYLNGAIPVHGVRNNGPPPPVVYTNLGPIRFVVEVSARPKSPVPMDRRIDVRGDRHRDHPRRRQRIRPHRPQLLARGRCQRQGHRDRGGQRPDRQRHARPPAEVRQHSGPPAVRGEEHRRRDHRGRQDHQGLRRARPRQAALGRPGRGRRGGVDRLLHRRQQGPRARRTAPRRSSSRLRPRTRTSPS